MIVRLALLLILFVLTPSVRAEAPAQMCERAAMQVATETGVPVDILASLTLTETGRRRNGLVRPWAWSVNAEGRGIWFDDPQSAIAFAEERIAQGRLNVDIGCFQLNYRWHGQHFASPAAMFDPLENTRYAARFVSQLHAEFGDWRRAAGAFHSRTPQHANRYLARFDELRAGFRARGFEGLADAPGTYNSFAALGLPSPQPGGDPPSRRSRAPPEQRLTLLGSTPGQAGRGGSLAILGGPRGGLPGPGVPLIGEGGGALIGG